MHEREDRRCDACHACIMYMRWETKIDIKTERENK